VLGQLSPEQILLSLEKGAMQVQGVLVWNAPTIAGGMIHVQSG